MSDPTQPPATDPWQPPADPRPTAYPQPPSGPWLVQNPAPGQSTQQYPTPYPMPYGYGYPAPPPPPPPRQRRTSKVVIAVVLAVVAVVGAAAGSLVALGMHSGAPTDAASDSLVGLLLPAPADSKPWPGKRSTEALDLHQMAALAANPTARANFLHEEGFTRGAVARWQTTQGSIVEIRLFQFDTVGDALYFLLDERMGTTNSSWGTPTDIEDIPRAVYYANTTVDKDGYVNVLDMAARDVTAVEIFVSQRPPWSPTEGNQLLRDQYARL